MSGPTFFIETLGCPKNQVDSDKLTGVLLGDGMAPAPSAAEADLVVVNTCAFVEDARQESVDTILALDEARRPGSRLVVTGCLAERSGAELAAAMPEVDAVAGFAEAVPVTLGRKPGPSVPSLDLLHLPRPAPGLRGPNAVPVPWAYVKVAEGCDKTCGFCAIPTFRGPQRSRAHDDVLAEVASLVDGGVREVVLVAQDLAAYGRDEPGGGRRIVPLVEAVAELADWVRLLYVHPVDLTDELEAVLCDVAVPYVDLSLQHTSAPLLRRMRRWGDGERFLERIERIRARRPDAAFRSNFIVGYPGETEADQDDLLAFVEAAQLDWCGFFPYSEEPGTYAAGLDGKVDDGLVKERLGELTERQDAITARRRDDLVGSRVEVLVDRPGVARSRREAPEIDGIVQVPPTLAAGAFHTVEVVAAEGPDLVADAVGAGERG